MQWRMWISSTIYSVFNYIWYKGRHAWENVVEKSNIIHFAPTNNKEAGFAQIRFLGGNPSLVRLSPFHRQRP
jgi:hypothetical protein